MQRRLGFSPSLGFPGTVLLDTTCGRYRASNGKDDLINHDFVISVDAGQCLCAATKWKDNEASASFVDSERLLEDTPDQLASHFREALRKAIEVLHERDLHAAGGSRSSSCPSSASHMLLPLACCHLLLASTRWLCRVIW